MLSLQLVAEVEQMLADGCRQRAIARVLPLSRGSVARIASGQWPHEKARRREEEASERMDSPTDVSAPVRCPGCGGKQTMPCRVCEAEQVRKDKLQKARAALAGATMPREAEGPAVIESKLSADEETRRKECLANRQAIERSANPPRRPGIRLDKSTAQPDFPDAVFLSDDDCAEDAA